MLKIALFFNYQTKIKVIDRKIAATRQLSSEKMSKLLLKKTAHTARVLYQMGMSPRFKFQKEPKDKYSLTKMTLMAVLPITNSTERK